MLGQRGLPDSDLLLVGGGSAARCVTQRGVTPGEIGAVVLERVQIFLVGERQHEVEVAPSLRRRAAHQLQIAGRKQYGRKRAERVTETADFGAIDRDFLSLGVAVESDRDLALPGRMRVRGDVKSGCVEARQVLIARVPNRTHDLEIVDRLEEVRLAVTVVANDDGAFGWKLEINALEIPDIANRDSDEPDSVFAGLA